jgi:hypothetical protein
VLGYTLETCNRSLDVSTLNLSTHGITIKY